MKVTIYASGETTDPIDVAKAASDDATDDATNVEPIELRITGFQMLPKEKLSEIREHVAKEASNRANKNFQDNEMDALDNRIIGAVGRVKNRALNGSPSETIENDKETEGEIAEDNIKGRR